MPTLAVSFHRQKLYLGAIKVFTHLHCVKIPDTSVERPPPSKFKPFLDCAPVRAAGRHDGCRNFFTQAAARRCTVTPWNRGFCLAEGLNELSEIFTP
jgi:hypothetical protein